MHYFGDYGFDRFLTESQLNNRQNWCYPSNHHIRWACSCFAIHNTENGTIFGRNFDWDRDPALLLFTNPTNGYASVSMVDISYLGFTRHETPSREDLLRLLDAPHWPFDGMNEYGLTAGLMAVPHGEGGNDPNKTTISSLQAIRLILDYAKNVPEAISLLQNRNIDFSGGPAVHYLIADRDGHSVVVEFIDNKMHMISNKESFQVSTNFLITNNLSSGANTSCWRYNHAYQQLEKTDGNITMNSAMSLLEDISQSNTLWTTVYNPGNGIIRIVMNRKYHEVHQLQLKMSTSR